MQFKYKLEGGITQLLLDVENKSGVALTSNKVVIIDVLDTQGNVFTSFSGDINSVKQGQKVQY